MKKSEYINKYGFEAYERKLERDRQYSAAHKKERAAYNKQYYAENKEQKKQYYAEHKESIAAKKKQHYAAHKEEKVAYEKQRYAENREEILAKKKQYYTQHKEERAAYMKQYHAENRESILEQQKQYRTTPIGRANYLVGAYRVSDKKYNRGICTITGEWIVDNIFTSSCVYCGESDWTKLGCDRIDNSKPHTIDNVVCCCGACNIERGTMPSDEFMAMKRKPAY